MTTPHSSPIVPLVAFATLAIACGCEPYRIEYHRRPAYYQQAAEGELLDEWTAPDGTLVRFSSETTRRADALEAKSKGSKRQVDRDGDGTAETSEPTPIWSEDELGNVTMRAFLPEHVIANLMNALREERYGEFYDQMLARATRDRFESESSGKGKQAFAAWCRKHRRPLMEMLNRMAFGYLSADVVLRKTGPDSFNIGFAPRIASQFKFREMDVLYEGGGVRLAWIR